MTISNTPETMELLIPGTILIVLVVIITAIFGTGPCAFSRAVTRMQEKEEIEKYKRAVKGETSHKSPNTKKPKDLKGKNN